MMSKNKIQRNLLAAQISYRRSELNEKSLTVELHNFFQALKEKVLKELDVYWNDDFMFQAQADLILAPIFESQKTYYHILYKHIKKEYTVGKATGKRHVILARKEAKRKSYKFGANKSETTKLPLSSIIKREQNLFGTSEFSRQQLYNQSFTASERTMNRIDSQINKILSDGYKEGWGQNKVANDITRRFEQLKDWEAKRIARTEIHNAHNMGIMQTYQDMDVQYTQWGAAHDARVRDSHVELDGEIIPFGGTYSNGLKYPGDTSGELKEWINCRCVNLPFIIPDGYMAPSFSPFHESDLIQTLDYWNQDELITQATQEASQIPRNEVLEELQRSNDFDIYRLPPGQREYYLKLKKNQSILKEAIETKNYTILDDLDHSAATMIESKASVNELGDDFLERAKEELDDYALEISDYEKIIKDKNIKVSIEPKGIKWKNDALKDFTVYNSKTGEYELFNRDEKFIRYYFKKENLTILESVDMDSSRVMHVYTEYKKLPKRLQNTNEIVLSSQKPVKTVEGFEDVKLGGYVIKGKGSRIVEFKKTLNETMDTIVHEATHNLEKDHLYYISNSKEYVLAFKKDQNRLLAQGKELKDTYVTEYAYSFTEATLESNTTANRAWGHRIYSEDLAESMKKYLRNKKAFTEDYPEKAKVLEKVLNGEFKPGKTIPYKKWHDIESERFSLTPKEITRNQELKWKQTDLVLKGEKLSSKEVKELDFYNDKITFDYLYNKKINGEILDKAEEKAFKDISKKWKEKLKIHDEVLAELKYFNVKNNISLKLNKIRLNKKYNIDTTKAVKYKGKTVYGIGESLEDKKAFKNRWGIKKNRLTNMEYNFVRLYSGDGDSIINGYYRELSKAQTSHKKRIIKQKYSEKWKLLKYKYENEYMPFDQALKISKTVFKRGVVLNEDIVVVRRQSTHLLAFSKFGIYHSDALLSTSISKNVKPELYGDYLAYIVIPKGTRIFYIEGITSTSEEFEILFGINKNLKFLKQESEEISHWVLL